MYDQKGGRVRDPVSSFQARAVVCALALLVSSCREGGGGGSAAGSAGRILPVTIAGIDSLVAPALAKAGVKFQTYIYAGGDDDALIRSLHPDWSGALPATFITGRGRPPMRWFVGGKSYEQLRAEVSGFLRP